MTVLTFGIYCKRLSQLLVVHVGSGSLHDHQLLNNSQVQWIREIGQPFSVFFTVLQHDFIFLVLSSML